MEAGSDIDAGFIGMDMRVDPSHLAQGYVSYAQNCRFTNGVAHQRRGISCMHWGPTTVSYDGEGKPSIDKIDPFIEPIAIGVFRDPLDEEVALIAANDKVWRCYPNNTARELSLPAGEETGKDVKFIQAFDTVLMLRGKDKPMLKLDAARFRFENIETEDRGDGTVAMPNASEGIFINNRLAVITGRDEVAVSDILDYTRYEPTKALFRINQGSDDKLVGMANVDNNTIALFKTDSIYLLRDFHGDLANARLDELTRNYGCIAPKTITRIGTDLVFLSRRGLCSIRVTEQGHIEGVDEPISKPIQPLIDAIDWKYAEVSRVAFHENRIYLAVPVAFRKQFGSLLNDRLLASFGNAGDPQGDGFTVQAQDGGAMQNIDFTVSRDIHGINNAILVYDLITRSWSSMDTGDELSVCDFVKLRFSRAQRLFFLGNSGFIFMYDDPVYCGSSDEVRHLPEGVNAYEEMPTPRAIKFKLETRGYMGSSPSKKRFHKIEINFSQRNAKVNANAIGDGPHERFSVIKDKTFSQTKYIRPFDAADYDPTNNNNDHQTDGREDYTLFARENEGDAFCLEDGVTPGVMQYYASRKPMRSRGTRMQIEITNDQGDIKVHSAGIHASIDDAKTTTTI